MVSVERTGVARNGAAVAGTLTDAWTVDDSRVVQALRDAAVGELRPVYHASNYVFIVDLHHPEHGNGTGVYKPARGERPLHDFPYGTLHRREVAAYELSRLLGWDIVPPTVERHGPEGEGSMQLFIEHEPNEHYFVLRTEPRFDERFIRFAAFDLIANNADRKGGHLLRDPQDRIWGIDNGLCFHVHDKLRTVIWDHAGTPLPASLLADVERVRACVDDGAEPAAALAECISDVERSALVRRCDALLSDPVLPEMYPWRCTPWPLI